MPFLEVLLFLTYQTYQYSNALFDLRLPLVKILNIYAKTEIWYFKYNCASSMLQFLTKNLSLDQDFQ